jgi:hypothetical protein
MWRCAPLILVAACSAAVGDPIGGREESPPAVDGGGGADAAPTSDAMPIAVTLTQSTSEEITPQNSVACVEQEDGVPIEHRENSFYRVFRLDEMGVAGRLEVSSVAVAIQSASSPAATQPMSVILHTLAGNELELDRLDVIGRADLAVANQAAGTLAVPVTASAEAGSKLVVELYLPDAAGAGHLLFPGSNAAGQSGPSYLRAPADGCDLDQPVDIADIGFPDMHLVVSVSGTVY